MRLKHAYELLSDFKGIMRERFVYYQKLLSLKWDAWFYVTGAELILLALIFIPIIVTAIIFAMHEINTFNDPFKGVETTYNLISIVMIAILIILNILFIFRKANIKEDENNKLIYYAESRDEIEFLRHIFIISILAIILLIIAFLLVNSNIMNNIELFTKANIDRANEFTDLFVNFTSVFKFIVTLKQIIPIVLVAVIIGLDAVWIKRLSSYHISTSKTDVLMDDEENVKF